MGDNVNKSVQDAERGIAILSKIGGLFAPKTETPGNGAAPEPLPEHLQALSKAIDGVIAKGVPATATPEVVKMTSALAKFLSGAGVKMLDDEAKEREALAKSLDPKVFGELVEKSVQARVDVIAKQFDDQLNAACEGIAKGFEGMAGKLDLVVKSVDERCAKLEKLSGVRQSIPGQESEVTKTNNGGAPAGGASSPRKPDANNVWRGMFDGVRRQALAQMGSGAAPRQ